VTLGNAKKLIVESALLLKKVDLVCAYFFAVASIEKIGKSIYSLMLRAGI